jgi:DNA-binding NarL/FixJ family response regulator
MQKVFIIEDEVLLRDLLCDLISNQSDLQVIGTSGDGSEGYRKCLEVKPDILVCDIQLPGLNGIEIIQRVKTELPSMRVLAVSGVFNISRIKRVLMTKPDGIIEKASGLAVMEKALHAVASGQVFYSPEIIRKMPELLTATEHDGDLESLTPREREVLQLIAEGLTTKEIAEKLFISVRTADVHRSNIMNKLNVHNVAGLTRMAIAFGLVEAPPRI